MSDGSLPSPARWNPPLRRTIAHGRGAGIVVIFVTAIIGIVLAPFGMEWVAKAHRNWVVLGNVGQAYGGISALISAIALVGVVGSLLVQARQHSLDRTMLLRGRQGEIYAIVREDPELYTPIIGGLGHDALAVKRSTFRFEWLQYAAAGYETGLVREISLRNEMCPLFFRYNENRQFWELTQRDWLDSATTRKRRRFVRIVSEELARAKASGDGLAMPYPSDGSVEPRWNRGSRRCLHAFAWATSVGFAILISRRRSH